MKLYASLASSFARKIRVMLIEKNISHEVEMSTYGSPMSCKRSIRSARCPRSDLTTDVC